MNIPNPTVGSGGRTAQSDHQSGYYYKGQTFTPATNYHGGVSSVSILAADVDGNGTVDLITANISDSSLTVLTNSGGGNFGPNARYNAPTVEDVVAADLDGDGKPDLAYAYPGGIVTVTNLGDGRFSPSSSYNLGLSHCLRAADLNGDGAVDLVAGHGSVLTNTGTGQFVLSYSTTFSTDLSLVLADVNGDGLPDWVEAVPNALVVLTNAGNGQFAIMATNTLVRPGTICAIDAKHNGRADIIVPRFDPSAGISILVMTNDGSGFLGSNTVYIVQKSPTCVTAADVNGDGLVDLLCSGPSSYASVLLNDGAGSFTNGASLVVEAGAQCIIAADLDGDGRLDLATANYSPNNVSLLFNQTSFPPAAATPSVTIARLGPHFFVSWPSDLPGWTLQKSSSGLVTPNWGPGGYDGYPITDDGTNQSLRVIPSGETAVFRLLHP
ncbi:MAG TPA: VCBS repeat-containing protein [Verrucomicrobiae bacterium]|nr:VCBS repeat-containing protein [Verrucomicrobiae bacterium]